VWIKLDSFEETCLSSLPITVNVDKVITAAYAKHNMTYHDATAFFNGQKLARRQTAPDTTSSTIEIRSGLQSIPK